MSYDKFKEQIIQWKGIDITIHFYPKWSKSQRTKTYMSCIEFFRKDGGPLPMTPLGRVILYVPPPQIIDDPSLYVFALLEDYKHSRGWQKTHLRATRNGEHK